MPNILHLPKRYELKIYDENEWIILEQELGSEGDQKVVIHRNDLPQVVDALCNFAGIESSKP